MAIIDKYTTNTADSLINATDSENPPEDSAQSHGAKEQQDSKDTLGSTQAKSLYKDSTADDEGQTSTDQFKNIKLLGYETLFVNDSGLQQLAWNIGIPPLSEHYGDYDYEPAANVKLEKTDLLRFNLGKFFYRFSENATENFQFVDAHLRRNGLKSTPLPRPGPPYTPLIEYNFDNMVSAAKKLTNSSVMYGESDSPFTISLPKKADDVYITPLLKAAHPGLEFYKLLVKQGVFNFNIPAPADLSTQGQTGPGATPNWLQHPPIDYEDHSFIFLHPYGENIADEVNNIKVLYANATSDYVFFQPGYEAVFGLPQTFTAPLPFELYLPNFNIMLAEKNNPINASQIDSIGNTSVDRTYAVHTTLNNRLPGNILRALKKTDAAYEEASYGRSGNEYCESWGRTFKQDYANIIADETLSAHTQKFKNVVYPPSFLKSDDINILKENFPFYNEIKFNTDTNTKVADLLSKSKLFDFLVAFYIENMKSPDNDDYYAYQKALAEDTSLDTSSAEATFTSPTRGPKMLPAVDFESFVSLVYNLFSSNDTSENLLVNIQENIISVDSEEFLDDQLNLMQLNPLIGLATKLKFLTLYSNFVKENLRTYKKIISGATCYNETLFYRIEKRDTQGNVIQNFYVLNESQIDDVTLVDSQVIYGKKYIYSIYAVQYVLGNIYSYGELSMSADSLDLEEGPGDYKAHLRVNSRQNAKLIEIPYVTPSETAVLEAPPLPPNVDFYSYKNEDKKVLIMLQPSAGERRSIPIAIKPEDAIAIANSSIDSEQKVLFKAEGDVEAYEMFRLSEDEFENGPRAITDFGQPGTSKKLTIDAKFGSPSFVDDIKPNKKYWYIFRSLDKKHTNMGSDVTSIDGMDFSNPTNIFEVKLINNDGATYLTVSTYDINYFYLLNERLTTSQETNRPFRKYLRIKPAFGQSFINEDPAEGGLDTENLEIKDSIKDYIENSLGDDVRTIKLGSKEQSVFGFHEDNTNADFNQFKIRIISKKTGKKIDVYTRFRKPILQK